MKNLSWMNNLNVKIDRINAETKKSVFRKILNLLNWDLKTKFDSELAYIYSVIRDTNAFTYLQQLVQIKDKWALFSLTKFTAASITSSRAESINSQYKNFFKKPQELNSILEFINHHNENIKVNYKIFTNAEKVVISKVSILNFFNNYYTEFAMSLIYRQYLESLSYKVAEVQKPDPEESFQVYSVFRPQIMDSARYIQFDLQDYSYSCPCTFATFSGVPCRHFLAIILSLEDAKYELTSIIERWKKVQTKEESKEDLQSKEDLNNKEDLKSQDSNKETKPNQNAADARIIRKIKNPSEVKSKGRPKSIKRQKNFIERNQPKKRKSSTENVEKKPLKSKKSKKQ